MKDMNIFFRVDSSLHIGTGHIMRCIVLAEALRSQGHTVTFICRELPGNSIIVLKNQHGNCKHYFANVDQSTVRPNLEAIIKDFCTKINNYRTKIRIGNT